MNKILIRAGIAPYESYSVREICRNNRFGDNVGNLLYAYSLFRWLMISEETAVIPDRYRPENGLVSDSEIHRINEEYDCYVIPLADAFRKNFEKHLRLLTEFVNRLRIPVVLIGGGMAARLEDPSHVNRAGDESIRAFLDAVLSRSAMAGFRGEYTLDYLKKLGYLPEQHITVIGCPSVYTFGPKAGMRSPDLSAISESSPLIVTNNIFANTQTHRFLRRVIDAYPDYLFLPQRVEELRMVYWGHDLDLAGLPKDRPEYPVSLSDPFYDANHALFPLSIRRWLSVAGKGAFAVGPRLHGGIACMLRHVPTLMIAKDYRMKEVADYHQFAYIEQSSLTEDSKLEELVSRADFRRFAKAHGANFAHYCGFLRANGLRFLYESIGPDAAPGQTSSALDKKMRSSKQMDSVSPYTEVSAAERTARNLPDAKAVYDMLPDCVASRIRTAVRRYV